MKIISQFTAIILLISICLSAQSDEDSTGTKSFGMFGFPYAFYSPETELAFGLGGMMYFRLGDHPKIELSNIVISGYYTINNQYKFTITPELYLSKSGDFISSDFYYGKFIDKFYGSGGQSEEIDTADYITNDIGVYINYQKNLTENIEVGVIYDYLKSDVTNKKQNPFLNNNIYRGSDGGISSGLGFSVAWDSRDYAYLSTRGWYYYASMVSYSKAFGSDFDFNEFIFDLREFYQLYKGQVVAFQFYGKFARGYPPFYELPRLGGGTTMRGYYEGRFRDRNYFSMQMEYKQALFWKIGIVVFGGFGDVAGHINQFKMKQLKYSYGLGLRYIFDLDERLTVRADFGFGRNTSGVYFSMQETF